LRFVKDELLSHLRSIPEFSGIATLHHVIKTTTNIAPPFVKTNSKKTRYLGKEALASLTAMSQQTDSPELQAKLKLFLKHQQSL
jgi:hypothetical protein